MTDMVQRFTTAELNRRNFLKFTGMLSAATALTAGLAACGGGDSGGGSTAGGDDAAAVGTPDKPQGTITGTLGYLLSGGFDPMNTSAAPALAANMHIFEGLVDLDPITREPYLALAKEMPTASSDGLTWTATLRDGATFSDGTPVTADDVAWSFNRILDPANAAITAGFISSFLEQVTATDASTVQFALKAPFALFTQRIAVVKIVPKALTGDAAASKAFDSAPIGSGPFKLDSASTTTGLVMSNNPGYNGPRPALVTKVVLNTTPDNAARLNDLQGGQSQAIEAVPYLDAASVTEPFEIEEKDSFNSLFLMFNCSAPPFDDKRVRQALHYAIDKKKLITTALQGYGTPATSYLDEGNADYQEAGTVYDYDPEKAKSLLKEAGVSDLSFELVTTAISFVSDSAPVIIDSWKAIGVNATLNTNPAAAVYGTIVPADTFRVLAASGDPTVYGPDVDLVLRWFYYGETWPKARERWTDEAAARCSELIDQAATQEGDEQQATWKKVLDLVSDEVPLYPVYHTKAITAWDPEQLTDFHGSANVGLYFLDVGTTS
jgi:peptide/nickel transport system substrate-binding protein